MSRTRRIWADIKRRCEDPTHPRYAHFGGRGIAVCPRWQDFAAFRADMGECPWGRALDRIDYNGDYAPENCRWHTTREHARSRPACRFLSHDGLTMPLSVWAERLGMKDETLWRRLKTGWSVEAALSTPVKAWSNKR